jgi:hypothetical protein
VAEAAGIDREDGRALVYGMPYADWKARHQTPASDEQLRRMEESVARNR